MDQVVESRRDGAGRSPHTSAKPGVGLRRPHSWQTRLGAFSAACFAALLVHALVFDPAAVGSLDVRLILEVQRIHWEPLGRWFDVLGQLTDAPGAIWAWFVAIVVFATLRWWLPALALLSLPFAGLVNETIARGIVGRHRPHLDFLRHTSENSQEGSFPSGHVVGAVLLYGFVWSVVGRRIRFAPLRWLVQFACAGVILLTGIDRVWNGAHWPTDVLAGYALGCALLVALILGSEWVERTATLATSGGDRQSDGFAARRPGEGGLSGAATALLGAVFARHRWLAVRLRAPSPESPERTRH